MLATAHCEYVFLMRKSSSDDLPLNAVQSAEPGFYRLFRGRGGFDVHTGAPLTPKLSQTLTGLR